MNEENIETLRWSGNHLEMIDQRILPEEFTYISYANAKSVAEGIRSMVIRGAPAIGCAAAYGVALEALKLKDLNLKEFISEFIKFREDTVIKRVKFDLKNFKYFIEPHIEQGPILERNKLPLGIVTSIRGSFRFRNAVCKGEYLHSGATPIDYRKDSVVAVSSLVNEMNIYWQNQLKKEKDLTITFGQFFTDFEEHSFAKSAGQVTFCIDVRSSSKAVLESTKKYLLGKVKRIELKTKTKFSLGKETSSEPAIMSKKLVRVFDDYAKSIKIKPMIMPSGAGHDSSVFANFGIPSIMLFIRNKNGSHNPKEYMSIKYFMSVFDVLYGVIIKKL